jgi:hypothetical protein
VLLPKVVSMPTRTTARATQPRPPVLRLEGVLVRAGDTAQRHRSEGRKELGKGRYRLVDEKGRQVVDRT